MLNTIGKQMYQWVQELFPINRSLTGNGVRITLKYIQQYIPDLVIHEVPTGTSCFDWTIPKEWNCTEAYIITPNGEKICNYSQNNLHLVGYSTPIQTTISYENLLEHLYYLEDQPQAIPYVTSYYKERWGFCMNYEFFKTLPKGDYQICIDSELKEGFMTYGELLIKGKSEKEIFLSTYVCHPSMSNNELSGPVVTLALAQFIQNINDREYSYRIIFIPETIGSIYYISTHLESMKKNIIAGFNVTTIGDDLNYSYIATRYGKTLSDKVAQFILKDTSYKTYSFLERGSDERQYCAPGVDLPIATICRTKFGCYPEYHTSLDNLNFISPTGLYGGYLKLKEAITLLERNHCYQVTTLCEPQMGKRNLYPTLSTKNSASSTRTMMNFLAYCDGQNDLIDIANIINADIQELYILAAQLETAKVIQRVKSKF